MGRVRAPLLAALAYVLLAWWTLAPAFAPGAVLTPSAFFSRGGPFPPAVRERVPEGVDILSDAARQFEPWLLYAARARAQDGEIPLWKDSACCGAPLVGNGQSALFFPTRFAALLVGAPPSTFAACAFVRVVLAALGAFCLARWLRASGPAAFVAGLAFGFGGFLVTFRLHPHADAAMLLPWLLLAADALGAQPSARRVGALALAAGLQDLAGHPQTALHGQLLALAWVGARAWRGGGWPALPRALGACAGALLLGAACAAVQLLPLAEYTLHSEALGVRAARAAFPALAHPGAAVVLGAGLALSAAALAWLARGRRVLGPGLLLLLGCGVTAAAWLRFAGGRPPLPLLLAADWYGDALGYMGPLNYVEANGAFVGAALPLAATGLLLGRSRVAARALAALAVLAGLAGLRAPLVLDALSLLPPLSLADNGRLFQVALLALALLAALGFDGLAAAARGTRARLAALLLAPVAALLGVQAWGVIDGSVRSGNVPAGPSAPLPMEVARVGLLAPELEAQVRQLELSDPRALRLPEPLAGPGVVPVLGYAALRDEPWGIQVLYGADSRSVLARWALVRAPGDAQDDLPPALRAAGDRWLYVLRAGLPLEGLPAEIPAVRLRISSKAGDVLLSEPLRPPGVAGPPLPFPARPAPGAGASQLALQGLAALLVLLAAGATGRALLAARSTLVALVAVSLLPFSSALAPVLPEALYHPASPALAAARALAGGERVLPMEPHAFAPEIPGCYGLRDVRGYDALHPARVAQLLRSATDWPGGQTSMELLPARQDVDLPLLGLMSVHLLLDSQAPRPDLPRLAWRGEEALPNWDPFPLHQNPHALPRARLVGRAQLEPDDELAIARLRAPDFDRAGCALLAEAPGLCPELLAPPDPAPDAAPAPPGRVEIARDRPDHVSLVVRVERPALLLLADTHFPGWVARVDGAERPILRANVAFRAVELRPGDARVDFDYAPRSYYLGEVLSLLAAALLYALLTAVGRD